MNNSDYIRQDTEHLWHPFTQMKIWPSEPPLVIERAEGNWLIDAQGKRYFDGVSSLWVTVHGHNHPRIVQAIEDQMRRLDHSTLLGLSHPQAIRLSARLARLSPEGLNRVFYSESGATAVEIALKIAFQFWQQSGRPQKKTFVALDNAYHGDTLGAVSVGGMELFHQIYGPLLFEVHRLPQPHCRRCPLGLSHPDCGLACAQALEPLLAQHGEEVCALIIEPRVQGAAGMIVQPEGYLSKLHSICREHEVLFIADEVATGFGRTGRMFACELEGISPDIMTVGKGLTGGVLPLAATLASEAVYEAFLGDYTEFKTFFHGHTYTGNPLACAAALASLELFEQDDLLGRLPARIEQLSQGLNQIAAMEHVAEVRQQGLMVGVELVQDKKTDNPYPPEMRVGHEVIMACRKRGVIIRPLGDTVVLMPPLSSTPEEIDLLLDALAQGIAEVTESKRCLAASL
ncbi:MAG: adenosylmethionine--8-amino-7-oxononanoate transaminase [Desulfarculaceae bacterium]|jgi:adenosylmethionine-8-amino-7-oxononanoate aminotransferase